MPLKRGPDGKLGVSGSGSNVVVNLVESPGSGKGGSTSTSTGSNGEQIITVLVEKIKGDLIKDVGSGGSFASAMEGQYSLNRSSGAWRLKDRNGDLAFIARQSAVLRLRLGNY